MHSHDRMRMRNLSFSSSALLLWLGLWVGLSFVRGVSGFLVPPGCVDGVSSSYSDAQSDSHVDTTSALYSDPHSESQRRTGPEQYTQGQQHVLAPSTKDAHRFEDLSDFGDETAMRGKDLIEEEKDRHNVSTALFAELEELARLVDIAYCVGTTGIQHPFECVSRCAEFPGYELVDTWNTGPLMSDSCGYIVLDHGLNPGRRPRDGEKEKGKGKGEGRIIVAFRGTYSITNTIVDLSTVPQEYVPYPGDPEDGDGDGDEEKNDEPTRGSHLDFISRPWRWLGRLAHRRKSSTTTTTTSDSPSTGETPHDDNTPPTKAPKGPKCTNCTVHSGFLTSWVNTRPLILPHISKLKTRYPSYSLHLVGHSLGGAVAALAALECEVLGYEPVVTTFGEPRIGNRGLVGYLDGLFGLSSSSFSSSSSSSSSSPLTPHPSTGQETRYRRLTHTHDPVPLLPPSEWSYRMHAGEIYISKPGLPPVESDLYMCDGDEDSECIAKGGATARLRMWQLFFAHREYFWRLGMCVPGGDPLDWGRGGYGKEGEKDGDGVSEEEEEL